MLTKAVANRQLEEARRRTTSLCRRTTPAPSGLTSAPAAASSAGGLSRSEGGGGAAAGPARTAVEREIEEGVAQYNRCLLDFCNCLWRNRALPTSDLERSMYVEYHLEYVSVFAAIAPSPPVT